MVRRHDGGNMLQSQDPQEGLRALPLNRVECAEALLGMGTRGEDGFHHLRGGRSTVGRPPDQALRGPCHIMPVGGGHVRGDRAVAPFKGSRTRDLRILFRGFSRSVCVVSISRSSGLKSDF